MITKFIKSLGYALKGVCIGIREERNVRIDITAAFYALWLSSFYSFSRAQYALLIFICFTVPAFEMMNTAVERTVKNPSADRFMIAGEAKDTAAGSVLIAAFGAFLAGIFLFWDIEVIKNIIEYFTGSAAHAVMLAVSAAVAYLFITADKFISKKNKKG